MTCNQVLNYFMEHDRQSAIIISISSIQWSTLCGAPGIVDKLISN